MGDIDAKRNPFRKLLRYCRPSTVSELTGSSLEPASRRLFRRTGPDIYDVGSDISANR